MSITYSECVFVALSSMQCACAILSSVSCPALQYFSKFFHKRHDFREREREEKKTLNLKNVSFSPRHLIALYLPLDGLRKGRYM
jgi:hypothetical protein